MHPNRFLFIECLLIIIFIGIAFRLFYWQILAGSRLEALAEVQYSSLENLPAPRGQIVSADHFPLVTNQANYVVYAYKPDYKDTPSHLAQQLAPLLLDTLTANLATPGGTPRYTLEDSEHDLVTKLSQPSTSWIALARHVPAQVKDAVATLHLAGIGFDEAAVRLYPEASMAAQLLGFVGSDSSGHPKGYFGLEGFYDLELSGRPGFIREDKDVQGRPIVSGNYLTVAGRTGRTLSTALDRGLQLLVESGLTAGLQQYQSAAGEIVIMEPQTGHILAMVARPSFDQNHFNLYPPATYRNPSISDTYEPGSTFKTVIMAAALDAQVIKPTDICAAQCAGPVTLGPYTLRTWNNEYHPGQTMTDILERSDNVGMIYVGSLLGKDTLVKYLHGFGFGQLTGIDLEGESGAPLRAKWGDVDVATSTFGQGIAITTIQMLTAVGAIANGGMLMTPQVVTKVSDTGFDMDIKPHPVRRVISVEAANTITDMMVQSALHGEAHWRLPPGYVIAGKTGTAQVPVAGHYDTEKTIASFIGFAPASNPRFVMIVKLQAPAKSPWASETAAPLWFDLATQVLHYLNVSPN